MASAYPDLDIPRQAVAVYIRIMKRNKFFRWIYASLSVNQFLVGESECQTGMQIQHPAPLL